MYKVNLSAFWPGHVDVSFKVSADHKPVFKVMGQVKTQVLIATQIESFLDCR